MPDDFTLYLLLVVALAIGYLLGRREPGRRRGAGNGSSERYLPSLHQIVNDQRGLDMEEYVESLVAHDDPVETRLALGALVRRRGEMDRAIRVHQGLLARTGLDAAQRSRIELELARDYLAAGLLGRAEKLLLELAGRDGPERVTAQRGLLEIYQREREWQQAVDVGRELARHDRTVNARLAHFQCELAEGALAEGDLRRARQALALGREFDADCARLSLIGARVELEAGHPRDACRALRRAVIQDADSVPLAVPLYRRAAEALDDEDAFAEFLDSCLEHGAYLPAVEARAGIIEAGHGAAAATRFVMDQLLRNPSLGGFVSLLEHLDRDGRPLGPEQLAQVRHFSESLLRKQAVHRCGSCGFSSHSLMWQCPSCHEWGSCRPITNADFVH
jgi:lipopolysaccharide biosynthesis regulator YciM